jgi:hypothetical protein
MGSNFQGARHVFSQVVWSVNGGHTLLTTSFVSSSQLTALVPADLLTSPVSAQVFVQTGDPMSDGPLQKSDSANFSVTALGGGSAAITEILPASAAAGSSDVTITLRGSNFNNERLNKSIVGWSTNSNDAHCCNSWLQTTFINTTELKAVIPADLLRAPISATVFVETGDPQGIGDGVSYPRSNFVVFTVGP